MAGMRRFVAAVVVLILTATVWAAGRDVYVVPFSHFDLFWAGTYEECLSRGNRIITKAVQLAIQHPEFRFLVEDEVWIANYVDSHHGLPELDLLKQLVKSGRLELAPKWAGIHQNLPRGEAHVRNLIYGKRYAREVFGVDPQVSHLGDLPGYTSQYPQILAKAGTPFVVMTRMGPTGASLFRWRSPDGSKALVWNAIKGYGWGVRLGLHVDMDDKRVSAAAQDLEQVGGTTKGPIYLGWGTDLWAPTEKLVASVALLNKRLAPLQFRFGTPEEYFRAAAKTADIPETSGEIPISWELVAAGNLWDPSLSATDTLLAAEKFAAINFALGYADYPQKEFEALWKHLLESMDHNARGQGGDPADDRKMEQTQLAALHSGEILRNMLRNIAARVQSPIARSTPIVVFNPLSWTRDDVVKTHVSIYGDVSPGDIADYRKAMRLVDQSGASVPFQVEQSYGTVSRALEIVFVARGVPSLGYKTYFLVPAEKPDSFSNAYEVKLDDPQGGTNRVIGSDQFDNEYYRVTVDRMTGRVTVFDKELNRAVVRDMEIAGTEERGGNDIAIEPMTGRTVNNTVRRVELEENNPVRVVVRIDGDLGGVPVVQRLFLHRGLKRVDLENTVDWKQDRLIKIEQLFPHGQPESQVRYGIPFGSVAAPDIMPGTGPRARDEIPREEWQRWRQIQDWICAGTAEGGLTIAADRQLISLGDGVIRVGMVRGTYKTQTHTRGGKQVLIPVPRAGTYVYRYALTSGKGNWVAAKPARMGMAFSTPLFAVNPADELSAKSLPPTNSFCSLAADNVIMTALKKAEADGSIVLRAFETDGSPAETPVQFLGERRSLRAVNLLEQDTGGGDGQLLRVKPYEIGTVRVRIR